MGHPPNGQALLGLINQLPHLRSHDLASFGGVCKELVHIRFRMSFLHHRPEIGVRVFELAPLVKGVHGDEVVLVLVPDGKSTPKKYHE